MKTRLDKSHSKSRRRRLIAPNERRGGFYEDRRYTFAEVFIALACEDFRAKA
jgi:hypothetical protein